METTILPIKQININEHEIIVIIHMVWFSSDE